MSENKKDYTEIFKDLTQYNNIIAYNKTKSIPQRFLIAADSNSRNIDLSVHEDLEQAFMSYYNVKKLPCMIIINKVVYDDKNFEAGLEEGRKLIYERTVEFIKEKIASNKIFMFIKGTPSRPECGFTNQLIRMFEDMDCVSGRDYDYFNIFEDVNVRQHLKTYNNWPTYPQVFINNEFVGGVDCLTEMKNDGSLLKMVRKLINENE